MHRILLIALVALFTNIALAWQPSKPVTVLLGFAPGSGNEISFRKASQIVQQNNPGVSFVIEHRPGADAVIAQNLLAQARADGHTISVPSHMSFFVTNDVWQKDVKKWTQSDFINVVALGQSPLALVATKNSVVDTPQQFKALVTMAPRPINIAIGGGAHQMAYEYMIHSFGADKNKVVNIRYPGPAQAVAAVAAETTEFGIMPVAIARPLIDAGRVKLIGLTGSHALEKLPRAPLLSETVPGINVYAGWIVSLSGATPKDIAEWYQLEFARAINSTDYQSWAVDNYIFVDSKQLTARGVADYGSRLAKSFEPIVKNLK
jgi:tripartite-type tricarboxylate transporter receptor subunit TctC